MLAPLFGLLAAAAPLELSALEGLDDLTAVVWERSQELQQARARVASALAERDRSHRLPNPGLDFGVGTLPIGPSNPVDLPDPFLNVPNVQVGLSVLLELGKRGPRQDAAAAAARSATWEAVELLRTRVIALAEAIGEIAAAEVRVSTLQAITADAQRLSELQRLRATKGDASTLDADRARLEEEGSQGALGEARAQLSAALRACAALASSPCRPFGNLTLAHAWLDRAPPTGALLERPDLKALEAAAEAGRAASTLAARAKLPDPTVRAGYVHDRFLVSGNQQNSLFVGLSFPLPLFQHGQDDAAQASASTAAAERSRALLIDSARTELELLERELEAATQRQHRLRAQTLPLATDVVQRLETAVARGAAPLQELLLARRALAELTLTEVALDLTVFRLQLAQTRLAAVPLKLPEALHAE